MIIETNYDFSDLESGKCRSCSEQSDEIVKDDGRCIDCIEDQNFFNETMKGI